MVKRVSLKDIAQQLGVSVALVSYVLNGKKTGRISKVVAEKIKAKAKELNYRTNQIARSLKTNRTNTIGFIVANIANPFTSYLARIIEDEASKSHFTVLFGSADDNADKSQKLIDTFITRQVDGLIIAPGEYTAEQIVVLQEQQIPFVLIDRYFPSLQTNYVALENFEATIQAVNHLVENQYKRIGLINYASTVYNLNERTRGYLHSMGMAGKEDTGSLIRLVKNEHIKENIQQAIDSLLALKEPVDAILFASNEIALYGVIHLNKLKIKVPEQLAVITFDELISWDLFYAPLTYIKQPLQQMGELAMKILLETIAGNREIKQYNLPGNLVIRESTRRGG